MLTLVFLLSLTYFQNFLELFLTLSQIFFFFKIFDGLSRKKMYLVTNFTMFVKWTTINKKTKAFTDFKRKPGGSPKEQKDC